MNPLWVILENYGWYIVFTSLTGYFVYKKWFHGLVEKRRSAKLLEQRKKFDEEVSRKEVENVRKARLRQQELHDKLEQEERVKKELKQKEELEKILKERSVLETAVGKFEQKTKKVEIEKQSAEEILEMLISSKPVIIFTKSFCPFSRKIRRLISTYRLEQEAYDFIDLDDENGNLPADEIQQIFETKYGKKSVPKMWVHGVYIGGFDEIMEFSKQQDFLKI